LRELLLAVLFTTNSKELFEVGANEFIVGIAAMHHFMAHRFKEPWHLQDNSIF
jgi:hypothetical protein